MAIKEIKFYNSSILRRQAKEIKEIDKEIKALAIDMLETMFNAKGVGLAAPQVGISKQLCIVYAGKEYQKMPYILINPVIIEQEGEQDGNEGCLSFPEMFMPIKRPFYVKVKALDVHENTVEVEGEELLARALIHEIDHLHGKLFIDYCNDKECLNTELYNLKERISCILTDGKKVIPARTTESDE